MLFWIIFVLNNFILTFHPNRLNFFSSTHLMRRKFLSSSSLAELSPLVSCLGGGRSRTTRLPVDPPRDASGASSRLPPAAPSSG